MVEMPHTIFEQPPTLTAAYDVQLHEAQACKLVLTITTLYQRV